jgi:excisionase family DNA binding protein
MRENVSAPKWDFKCHKHLLATYLCTIVGVAPLEAISVNMILMTKPLPRLMTLKQASEYLGLTVWAIRERIWDGQLPVVTFPKGRKQYIDRDDVEAFIQKNKRTIDI